MEVFMHEYIFCFGVSSLYIGLCRRIPPSTGPIHSFGGGGGHMVSALYGSMCIHILSHIFWIFYSTF
jgi:hypothetical protein